MELPKYFYRVYDDLSVSRFNERDGFVAGAPGDAFDPRKDGAKYVVERHMYWFNDCPTPFISVTASRKKAIHYANQRRERENGNVRIAKIDTDALLVFGVSIYHMATLVEDTGAVISDKARNPYEYLCLHHIPLDAVIYVTDEMSGEDSDDGMSFRHEIFLSFQCEESVVLPVT